jgi:hypothetical protein
LNIVHPEDPPEPQQSFLEEVTEDDRSDARRLTVRLTLGFAALFGFVFFAFWWSGSAIRFGAARVTASNVPSYRVWGTVRDAQSGRPIPWAAVEDDPSGDPPLFRADADATGAYELVTLAAPHQLRISAIGYRPAILHVGKPWFVWWPRGEERHDVSLAPE